MKKNNLIIALFFFGATLFAYADGDVTVTEIKDVSRAGSLSSDGATIVMVRGENSDSLVLHDIESGEESAVLNGAGQLYSPRIDPTGQKIIFAGGDPFTGLWIVGTDGSDLQPFPSKRGASVNDSMPVWSPDGTRVAWTRRLTEGKWDTELWIANANGSEARTLVKKFKANAASKEVTVVEAIDWIDNKILIAKSDQTKASEKHNLLIVDDATGKVTDTGLGGTQKQWAQFCESPDYLMYIDVSQIRFWSVPDKAVTTNVAPLKIGGNLKGTLKDFTRSANSAILLINTRELIDINDFKNGVRSHMYLIK